MNILGSQLRDFGYIVLKNAIEIEGFDTVYDKICSDLVGYSLSDYEKTKKTPVVTLPLERNPSFLQLIGDRGLKKVIEEVFGLENLYLWGSDFSTFAGSSSWHRDVSTKFPFFKCLIYLNGSYGKDQQFQLIPGSHRVDDSYAKALKMKFGWPKGPGFVKEGFISSINLNNRVATISIPAVNLEIEKGDIIIFDQRLWHAVRSVNLRRLIAVSFVPSYRSARDFWSNPVEAENLTEEAYTTLLFRTRVAMRHLEMKRMSNYMSSQRGLGLEQSWIAPCMKFDSFSEEDFAKEEEILFSSSKGEEYAWSYLNI